MWPRWQNLMSTWSWLYSTFTPSGSLIYTFLRAEGPLHEAGLRNSGQRMDTRNLSGFLSPSLRLPSGAWNKQSMSESNGSGSRSYTIRLLE
jgi:hypothetical protein